nr:replication protein A 70 kDa DNA-binding subunit B-like [Ipomoea batatas]
MSFYIFSVIQILCHVNVFIIFTDLIGRFISIHQPKNIQVKQNSQRLIDFVIEDGSLPRFLTPIRTISTRSRNTGSGSLETMSNENITVTSLMNIYDDKKIGEFWVVGEISDIERDWYFIACVNKGCGKKLQVINDQMYYGQLILWDNVCSPLLGITASELKGKYSEEDCMPNEIKGLIGKTMKFMIVTREDQFKYRGNAAFTVLGVQADEAISNYFKKGEQGSVIRKLAEEKEFNENFGQVCTI